MLTEIKIKRKKEKTIVWVGRGKERGKRKKEIMEKELIYEGKTRKQKERQEGEKKGREGILEGEILGWKKKDK